MSFLQRKRDYMFGNTLLVINPTARSHKAAEAGARASVAIKHALSNEPGSPLFEISHTVSKDDGRNTIAHRGKNFSTVIVVGGDGIVHEAINGIMQISKEARPTLGVIPCGNGDDFARSLSLNRSPDISIPQLFKEKPKTIDLIKANDRYYAQTLSFGLDAAIALETMHLRKKTNRTGTSLYLQAGIDQLLNYLETYTAHIQIDNEKPEELEFYLLAIQNGPTYGGGFTICPEADLSDGYLDICYAIPPLNTFKATKLFLKAKNGKHTKNPNIRFRKAKKVQIDFSSHIPTQIDGEEYNDTSIAVSVEKDALQILVP